MWPAGVITRPVSLGQGVTMEAGEDLAFTCRVVASRDLVWFDTGTAVLASSVNVG